MTREELTGIFNHYLNRDFTNKEWISHGNKNPESFRREISKCEEYNNLQIASGPSPKIGILLTGHIRKKNILRGFVNFLSKYDYDVFIHTWDTIGVKGEEMNLNAKEAYDEVVSEIHQIPNVVKYVIENNKEYIDTLEDITGYFNFSSPEKFIKSQLYSVNSAFKLLEQYSQESYINYDVIFKFRFDNDITSFNLLKNQIEDIKNNKIIFVPNSDCGHTHLDNGTSCYACDNMYYKHELTNVHIFPHTNVVCDIFAYGNFESMKSYCSLYEQYDELNKSFLADNLKSFEINNKTAKLTDGDYILGKKHTGHVESLYYFYCSYPERLLQMHLKDYMLIESKSVKVLFKR
jgi:hypothetical protein